jgi:hypothetical protein
LFESGDHQSASEAEKTSSSYTQSQIPLKMVGVPEVVILSGEWTWDGEVMR